MSHEQVKRNFAKTISYLQATCPAPLAVVQKHKSVKESGQTEVSVALLVLPFHM